MRRVLTLLVLSTTLLCGGVARAQQFVTFLSASPLADGQYWFLTEPLRYDLADTGIMVTVPRGFVTDFTSIPRPFWTLLPRWGKYGAPAVVHDFLYWDQRCTREQADQIMKIAMGENQVGWFRRGLIHRGLRWGGALAWRNNASRRRSGEIRVVPRDSLPQNPNTTWKELSQALKRDEIHEEPRGAPESIPDYCTQAQELLSAHN